MIPSPGSMPKKKTAPTPGRPVKYEEGKARLDKLPSKLYLSKPRKIEAAHVNHENIEAVSVWCGGEVVVAEMSDGGLRYSVQFKDRSGVEVEAQVGKFIGRSSAGFYVMSATYFNRNFEEA